MGKVTDIVLQKKDPARLNIYIDNNFALGISAQLRFEKRLEIGQPLTEKQIQDLIAADQTERLLNKAFNFLSFRPRSEKETRDHLLRKGKLKEIKSDVEKKQYETFVEAVINKLKKAKQLDDFEFSKWWVEQRIRFNPRGDRLLKNELKSKGVDNEIIDQLLVNNNEDQIRLATKAADKKIKSYQKLDSEEIKIKLGQYLARRGFGWEVIKKAVDTFVKKG